MIRPMPTNLSAPLHIFKPGRHTAMSGATLEFSAADLHQCAAAYDPAKFEAPLVVGHPRLDAPAYGWVSRLTAGAAGLEADPHQVDAAFADMVNEGRFKKISASFFLPDAPGNPVPGVHYLRHVGFLGAAAPAVPGLRTPTFDAAAAGTETIEFANPLFNPEEITTVTPEEKAALEAENAQLKQQIADAAAREKAAVADRRHADHAAFCDGLVKDGKMAPGLVEVVVATLDYVAAAEGVVEFAAADGARKPLAEALKAVLAAQPALIDFAERSADTEATRRPARADFAAPAGYAIDAAALDLHRKASAHAVAHHVDYAAAVRAVATA